MPLKPEHVLNFVLVDDLALFVEWFRMLRVCHLTSFSGQSHLQYDIGFHSLFLDKVVVSNMINQACDSSGYKRYCDF